MKVLLRVRPRPLWWTLRASVFALLAILITARSAHASEFVLITADGELVFESAADQDSFREWVSSGGRSAWLYLVDGLMLPCYRNDHKLCRDNMAQALKSIPPALANAKVRINGKTEQLLLAVRNGQFLYPVAPSFRLLKAIVADGGGCDQWETSAAALTGVTTGALAHLKTNARNELEGRTLFKESRQLDALLRLAACTTVKTGN